MTQKFKQYEEEKENIIYIVQNTNKEIVNYEFDVNRVLEIKVKGFNKINDVLNCQKGGQDEN